MTTINENTHQATYDAFNKLNQDAASNDDALSSTVQADVAKLEAAVNADAGLTTTQKSSILNQVEELLPMAGVAGNGAEWNADMQTLVDSLMALQTTSSGATVDGADAPTDTDGSGAGLTNSSIKDAGEDDTSTDFDPTRESTQAADTGSPAPLTDRTLYPSGRAPSAADIFQGETVKDCTVMADLTQMVNADPAAVANMISPDGKGGYNVKLYLDSASSEENATSVNVSSADLVSGGATSKADSAGSANWVSYIEAAVVKSMKSWDDPELYKADQESGVAFKNGADPRTVMALLTGTRGNSGNPTDFGSNTTLLNALSTKLSEGKLINLGSAVPVPDADADTLDDTKSRNIKGHTIYDNHAYFVNSVDLKKGTVTLDNPWNDANKTDGDTFTMSVDDFKATFPRMWYQS